MKKILVLNNLNIGNNLVVSDNINHNFYPVGINVYDDNNNIYHISSITEPPFGKNVMANRGYINFDTSVDYEALKGKYLFLERNASYPTFTTIIESSIFAYIPKNAKIVDGKLESLLISNAQLSTGEYLQIIFTRNYLGYLKLHSYIYNKILKLNRSNINIRFLPAGINYNYGLDYLSNLYQLSHFDFTIFSNFWVEIKNLENSEEYQDNYNVLINTKYFTYKNIKYYINKNVTIQLGNGRGEREDFLYLLSWYRKKYNVNSYKGTSKENYYLKLTGNYFPSRDTIPNNLSDVETFMTREHYEAIDYNNINYLEYLKNGDLSKDSYWEL